MCLPMLTYVLTQVNLCAYPGEPMCLPRLTYVLTQVDLCAYPGEPMCLPRGTYVLTQVNLCAYPGEPMCLPRGTYVLAQVLAKGKQFMLLIRHSMCYSYIYMSGEHLVGDGRNEEQLRKKNYCHVRYGYFGRSDRDDDRRHFVAMNSS